MTLAQKLRQVRRRTVLSQAKLAEATGLSVTSIQSYERGTAIPRRATLELLASAMSVPIEDLDDNSQDEIEDLRERALRLEREALSSRAETLRVREELADLESIVMVVASEGGPEDPNVRSHLAKALREWRLARRGGSYGRTDMETG